MDAFCATLRLENKKIIHSSVLTILPQLRSPPEPDYRFLIIVGPFEGGSGSGKW